VNSSAIEAMLRVNVNRPDFIFWIYPAEPESSKEKGCPAGAGQPLSV
jgi:hypothetical protein